MKHSYPLHRDKYRRRKLIFWITLVGIILLVLLCMFLCPFGSKSKGILIRAGICGAIHRPAVYDLPQGADLAMLIRMANGVTPAADLSRVNLDHIIMHDSIYHIPTSGDGQRARTLQDALTEVYAEKSYDYPDSIAAARFDKEVKKYTILYIGLPAVYVLITYYPEGRNIQFTHIPHSTVLLRNNFRISDIFFTLGIAQTKRILENRLKVRIDHYLIQDRFTFSGLIDDMGGIAVRLDTSYAKQYDFDPGIRHIDGFHSWEFVRYLDLKSRNLKVTDKKSMDVIRHDNFTADPNQWAIAYEQRNQRQRIILNAMRSTFVGLSTSKQLQVVADFHKSFETDLDNALLMSLYKDILSSPNFTYGSLPGYYSNENNKLYFYPDFPSFRLLLNTEIRNALESAKTKEQVVY